MAWDPEHNERHEDFAKGRIKIKDETKQDPIIQERQKEIGRKAIRQILSRLGVPRPNDEDTYQQDERLAIQSE